jgi:cell division protein FtsI/penicillin-binding protein 2
MKKKKFAIKGQNKFFPDWRIALIIIIVFILAGGILARFFLIQVFRGSFYSALAQNQQQILEKLMPQRGDIVVQDKFSALGGQNSSVLASGQANGGDNYFTVATNKIYQMVYIVPKEIPADKKDEAVKSLSQILALPEEGIKGKVFQENDPYEPIAHKITDQETEGIKNLKIKGIYLAPETWRFYPADTLLSQVLGFVGFSSNKQEGQYGLEEYYQKELEGEPGLLDAAKDAIGRWVFSDNYNLQPAKDGDKLVLTIDQNIQFMAEKELNDVKEKWKAESGTAIVMDPKTGRILAMASLPNFDPNEYEKATSTDVFLNPAIQKVYEPGSVFKPITMSAAINEGKVTPDTTYTDAGILKIGGYTIQNAADKSYGVCTMTKVLEKSINTGAVFAERSVGPDVFSDYVKKFGFGEKTGIDLASEVAGSISNLKKGGPEINFATASFGQGISVTPIELISGLGAIANQGKLMKPYLVDKIIGADGKETTTEPIVRSQVISPETASKLTSMLVSTVRNGYDKIKIPNYYIAGKTGTAEVPDPLKRGYGGEFIHTFVGWAPAFDPKFIILLKLDKPQGTAFASNSLAPTFADLTKYLLNYYEIPPEE